MSTPKLAEDDSPKRILATLAPHIVAAEELTSEVNRLQRANNLLREDLKKQHVDLRASKQKQAVMEDALEEMRAELPPTHDLLTRMWSLLESSGLKIPDGMVKEYKALKRGDRFDTAPARKVSRTKRGRREGARSRKVDMKNDWVGEQAALFGKGTTTSREETWTLLHSHDGRAYDMENNVPLPYDESEKDKIDGLAKNADDTDTQIGIEADFPTATDCTIAGKKRKNTKEADTAAKILVVDEGTDKSAAGPVLTLEHRKTGEVNNTPVPNQSTEESDEDFEEGEIKD